MKGLRKVCYLSMLLIFLVAAEIPAKAADTYTVDPVHSFIVFKIGHLNIGYVIGMFTDFSGTITADRENPEKSSVEMTVKVESINTHVEKRDKDLRSDNFFDAVKFPEIHFKSTKVRKVDAKTYKVTGNMGLHGVTREMTVTVNFLGEGKDPWGGYRMAFNAEFDILRSDYGMNKEIPAAGDKVHLSLSIEALKQVEKK